MALPKSSPDEDNRLKKKYEPELQAATTRLMAAAMRAGTASQGEVTFMNAVQRMSQRMSNLK